MLFNALTRQEIGWHDLPANAAGKLCADLATEIHLVKALSGEALGQNVLILCTTICVFVFSFVWGYWKIVLVALATVPIMASGMVVEYAVYSGDADTGTSRLGGQAGRIVGEVTTSIRTIASFTLEPHFNDKFVAATDKELRQTLPREALKGFFVGYATGSMLAALALLYWYGGEQVASGNTGFRGFILPIFCMFMLGASLGQVSVASPLLCLLGEACGPIMVGEHAETG